MASAGTILVVDDDPGVREALETALSSRYQVQTAATASAALDALAAHQFDLILLDYRLPDLPGTSVLQAIKRFFPSTLVILMTGFGTEDVAVQALRGGARDYIRKPVDLRDLHSRVAALLAGSCTWRTGRVEHYLGPVLFRYAEPPEANAHVGQVVRLGVWGEAGVQGGVSVGLAERIAASPRVFDAGESGPPIAPARWSMPLSPLPPPAPRRWNLSLLYLRVEGVAHPRFISRRSYVAEVLVGTEANALSVGAVSRTRVEPPENALSLLRFEARRPMETLFWAWPHAPGRDLPLSNVMKEGEP